MVYTAGPKLAQAPSQDFQSKPVKKPAFDAKAGKSSQTPAKNKEHGSWGPLFKNKENFKNMHLF